jgi:hypothetical protein
MNMLNSEQQIGANVAIASRGCSMSVRDAPRCTQEAMAAVDLARWMFLHVCARLWMAPRAGFEVMRKLLICGTRRSRSPLRPLSDLKATFPESEAVPSILGPLIRRSRMRV